MGNSALIRRGTEVLAALVIVVVMAYVSTVTRNSNTADYSDFAVNTGVTAGIDNNMAAGDAVSPADITLSTADTNLSTADSALPTSDAALPTEDIAPSASDTAPSAEDASPSAANTAQPNGEAAAEAQAAPVNSQPPVYKYVSVNTLNIRSGPSADTEKLGSLTKGARIQVLGTFGEWLKIITGDKTEGFVFAEYTADSLPPVYKYVNVNTLNIRSGPGKETEKLGTLSYGARVQALSQEGEWTRIITKDNVEGYVFSDYIVADANLISRSASGGLAYNADLAASVIEYAKQFLGVKYVYGGFTPKGFDCSGFTKYVFQKFKINVPRSSVEYDKIGTKISRTDMKPGDILLFDAFNDNRLSHVGIYLGKDQFIHASTSKGKVVIATLSKYSGKLVGIRRVIK